MSSLLREVLGAGVPSAHNWVCVPDFFPGSGAREASPVHVYVLVVVGTLLGALILGCLFKR